VEVPEDTGLHKVGKVEKALDATNKAFNHLVQSVIVENCKVLVGAFAELKGQFLRPKKATAEFGLHLTFA
jgi:hypothetical protein